MWNKIKTGKMEKNSGLKSFQILGCMAGHPIVDQGVTSVVISDYTFDIMIDCGEGTYINLLKNGYKLSQLRYILITHMHVDHLGGLVPFLFYKHLLGYNQPMTLIGPPNLEYFITSSFKYQGLKPKYQIFYVNIENETEKQLSNLITLKSAKLNHKIPCWGYRLEDKKNSIVFITDTTPTANSVELSKNATYLIHESTFLSNELALANKTFHTTIDQAKDIAKESNAKNLILTHFSQSIIDSSIDSVRYKNKKCAIFNEKIFLTSKRGNDEFNI